MSINRAASVIGLIAATAVVAAAQQPPPTAAPVFRSGVSLELVDVVVRDKSGAVVKGLTADDFELLEDGKRQQIATFSFEEVMSRAEPAGHVAMLAGATADHADSATLSAAEPRTTEAVAGRRLLLLVFDTSSMQPEDARSAADAAMKWVGQHMSPADLVAVASIGGVLRILTDFTISKAEVQAALATFSAGEGATLGGVDRGAPSTAAAADVTEDDSGMEGLDSFNNDVRLRALKAIAGAVARVQQKKAVIYFTAGIERNGSDNQVELRAAVNTAVRANVAFYPVDVRGLQAVVPGGTARHESRGGVGALSGGAVAEQFDELSAQQETLLTLATETGGTAFTNSNDFGEAFAKAVGDISSYYILGFASSNTAKDGRFRRVSVRLRHPADRKVEARKGYYADRDFTHTVKRDREIQLQEQLATGIPATNVPLFVWAGWFRLTTEKYYVPIALTVPGSAVPTSAEKVTLDVAGSIRSERGATVGRIRDTIVVPQSSAGSLATRQVLYQTGVLLPPGRFAMKVVVRENATGQMGTFETPIVVPELERAPVKVSSLVLSTQMQNADGRQTPNPLVHDGVEIIPNLAHIVGRGQQLHLYYEVYDPASEGEELQLRTNLAFYRGKVKVFETPLVDRTRLDADHRGAVKFQVEIPTDDLRPGLYTCQVNVIDAVAGQFVFPRLELFLR